jgi:hypothetical protein
MEKTISIQERNEAMTLSIQDLAMFYGCPINSDWYGWEGKILDAGILREIKEDHKAHTIKPILRPLSSMTDIEAIELAKLQYPGRGNNPEKLYIGLRNELINGTWGGSHTTCKYLLQNGFDIYEWIEKGLAIEYNKTTKEEKK